MTTEREKDPEKRDAQTRLARRGERMLCAWAPTELVTQLDAHLARKWAEHPDRTRPSRQQFLVAALKKALSDGGAK